ncbi:hypothetical protein D3C75_473820 [compost metagenome]
MARLNQRGVGGGFGSRHVGDALEEVANRHGVGGVVCALVNHLQHIVFADHAGSDLDAAGSPAIGHRHFSPAKRHLITRNGDRFENGAAQGAFGLLIQISKVVAGECLSHDDVPFADV